ncbi:MAG: FkbM family methyltransferase [Candidatus Sedimenticola sp. PURPLELP]
MQDALKSVRRFLRPLVRSMRQAKEMITGRGIPNGSHAFHDLRWFLPNLSVQVIFDVGANVGTVTNAFSKHFPEALIFCFEPAPNVHRSLLKNTENKRIRCFPIALSDNKSTATMHRVTSGRLYNLENTDIADSDVVEQVKVETLESFCTDNDVERINYLKIHTGGHDLSVLRGADSLLAQQSIDVVEVEACMSPDSDIYSTADEMKTFLEHKDYRLFATYEQENERPTHEHHLRRTNLVFISRAVINSNSG